MIEEYTIIPENTDFFKHEVLGIEFEDIQEQNDVRIFTYEDGRKFFVDKRRKNKKIKSEIYKDVKIDREYPNIIYCDTENTTRIYLRNKEKFLAKIPQANLRFLSIDNDGNYYFAMSAKESLKEALIKINNKEVKILTAQEYHITKVFEDIEKMFLLSSGNSSKVIKVEDEVKEVYDNLELARYYREDKTITYAKGIISENVNGEKQVWEPLTKTIPLGKGLYELVNGEEVGLWYAPYGLVAMPSNKAELLTFANYYDIFKETGMFIYGLETDNEVVIGKVSTSDNHTYVSQITTGIKAAFLPGNLLVVKKENETVFYNMYGLKKLVIPKDVKVEFVYPRGYREYEVYEIDGDYYKYNGKELIKIRLKEKDMFIAGVRTALGDIAINCYDEDKFIKICNYFNKQYNQKEIECVLGNLYNEEVERKYPNLRKILK